MAGTTRIKLFAEYLASKGHMVTVIVTSKSDLYIPSSGNENLVDYFYLGPKSFSFINYIIHLLSLLSKVRYTLRNLHKNNYFNSILLYDGINVDNFLFAFLGKKLDYIIVPDIVEDYSLSEEKMSLLYKAKMSINLKFDCKIHYFVHGAIVISSFLEKKYSRKLSAIKLIPISASNLNSGLKVVQSYKTDITFLYSGTYGKKDGVEDLILAFNFLKNKYPNIKLVLAGSMKPHIKKMIDEIDNQSIIQQGFIPSGSYFDFLNSIDILCMTRIASEYANAGFPFKLGEYLATGKPVIATDVSDISLYLEDKKDAIIARPSDNESLKNAMEYAILNQDKWEIIGSNGKAKAELYFNPENNGNKLIDFLYELHSQND